jgi:hypothetical protein
MSFKNLWLTSILGFTTLTVIFGSLPLHAEDVPRFEFNPYEPHLDPAPGISVTKSVELVPDVLDTFVKAVDNNLPLVVLFVEPADSTDRNLILESDEARRVLETDVLTPYANDAMFAVCELSETFEAGDDEYGFRVARHLGVSTTPTLVVVAPNIHDLTVSFSAIGGRAIAGLKKDLNAILVRATTPELTWNPPSPAAAAMQLGEALKNGQMHRVRASFASGYSIPLKERIDLAVRVGNAKRNLLSTIDAVFGPQTESLAGIDDDEAQIASVRRCISHEVLEVTTADDATQVRIRWIIRDGDTVHDGVENFNAVFERGGWRLISENVERDIADVEAWVKHWHMLPEQLEQVSRDVEAGRITSATDARAAALHVATTEMP